MPNCKFCGKPVISARAMHAYCWEQKVMELTETVCDSIAAGRWNAGALKNWRKTTVTTAC